MFLEMQDFDFAQI